MRTLVIEPSKAPEVREIADYDELSAAVGGYIELAPLRPPFSAYINTDGKQLRLPVNMIATALCKALGPGLLRGDYITGTMVIYGPVDSEGSGTPITDEMIEQINKAIAASLDS